MRSISPSPQIPKRISKCAASYGIDMDYTYNEVAFRLFRTQSLTQLDSLDLTKLAPAETFFLKVRGGAQSRSRTSCS